VQRLFFRRFKKIILFELRIVILVTAFIENIYLIADYNWRNERNILVAFVQQRTIEKETYSTLLT